MKRASRVQMTSVRELEEGVSGDALAEVEHRLARVAPDVVRLPVELVVPVAEVLEPKEKLPRLPSPKDLCAARAAGWRPSNDGAGSTAAGGSRRRCRSPTRGATS